jgi:hypothetical protein
MTFQELLEVYNGQYIEISGTNAKNQCVDLANSYIKYVLRLPPIEFTNAVDFPSKAGDNYDYFLNSPTGVPKEGDLVIWGGNQYGHIAIFIEGNANRFTSFDENFPTGSPCHVQEHNYINPPVLGWLHPKRVPEGVDFGLLVKKATQWDFTIKYLEIPKDPKDTLFEEARSVIGGYKSQITTLQTALSKADQEALNRTEQAERYKQSAEASATQLKACQTASAENDKTKAKLLESMQGRIIELEGQVDTTAKDKGRILLELAACKAGEKKAIGLVNRFILWLQSLRRK